MSNRDIASLTAAAQALADALGKAKLPGLKPKHKIPSDAETNDNGGWWSHVASWKGHASLAVSLDRYPTRSKLTLWVGFWSGRWELIRNLFADLDEPAVTLENADVVKDDDIYVLDPPLSDELYDSPIAEHYSGIKYYGLYQREAKFNLDRAIEFVSRVVLSQETNRDALQIDLELIERDEALSPTMKKELRLARRGQGKFRTNLDELWCECCPLTKHSTRALLRASHIVGWADAKTAERLDPYNGILLSANVDALFDKHLISFDKTGALNFSRHLDPDEIDRLRVNGGPIAFHDRHKPYLRRHWERFQKKQGRPTSS